MQQKRYGIAVFHHIGDVLCCTPIAKQLKASDPTCHITYFTSVPGEVVLRHNPDIDELVVLPGDQYALDQEIPGLMTLRPWTRFFTPAAYMNYEAIPGGSIYHPKGTIFGLVRAGARLDWTVPFTFPFVLTAEEQAEARAFWNTLPPGKRILVETDYRSEQSPWTDEYNFDMLTALKDCDPVFVFTAKERPSFFERFHAQHPKSAWCHLPFRLNAELFNLCDAYVGVSSGISCLTYSEYCRTDVPRIEVTRGEHWGAAELPHHTELQLCYSKGKFFEALNGLRLQLLGVAYQPDFTPRCDLSRVPTEKLQVALDGANVGEAAKFLTADLAAHCVDRAEVKLLMGGGLALSGVAEKLSWVVRPNGTVILEAPNAEGVVAASVGAQWGHLAPDDRSLFKPLALRETLIQAGFWIERWETLTRGAERAQLMAIVREARKDLDAAGHEDFANEIDRRGGGDWIRITARKRGGYKGRVAAAVAQPAPTRIVQMDEAGTPLISAVIPCFNQAPYLAEAVHSVLAQSYPHLELLIVNDGSTDDSSQVAAQLARSDRRVKVVEAEHGGPAEARDLGIAMSSGEWILALDADDALAPSFIENALRSAAQGADVVVSGICQTGIGEGRWHLGTLDETALLRVVPLPLPPFFTKDLWSRFGGLNCGAPWGGGSVHFWLSCLEHEASTMALEETYLRARILREGQVHHRTLRHWRVIAAMHRTIHAPLFSYDEVSAAHEVIGSADGEVAEEIENQLSRFPGLPFPYLWRGLMREQNGLFEAALSDYDACARRISERQAGSLWQVELRKSILDNTKNIIGAKERA